VSTALHHCEYLKQLPTVRTVIWSSVAVYMTFMSMQVAGVAQHLLQNHFV